MCWAGVDDVEFCKDQADVMVTEWQREGKKTVAGSQVFRNEGWDSLRTGHPELGARSIQPYTSCCNNLHANTTMLPD